MECRGFSVEGGDSKAVVEVLGKEVWMNWRNGLTMVLAFSAVLLASAVWGQGATTGSLSGKVQDEKGQPIPGASVTVTSNYLQGERGTATDVNGDFVIPYLPPANDYRVKAEAEGFNKVIQSNITVNLGSTTTMQITLAAGGTEIQVTAQAPSITLKEGKVSTQITQQELSTIPVGRSYQDALLLAPQVMPSGAGGNPAVAGGNSTSNQWVVNGLNTTDPVTGTFGSNLNFNFVREMEIDTGGLSAEYSGTSGGLFNVLTKSGTNEFHGEIFGYYTNDSMSANAHSTDLAVTKPTPFHRYDYGFDVGGPIVKDRLWFFVGYNPVVNSVHYEGVQIATNVNGYRPDVGSQISVPYKYDDYRRTWTWATKFNYRVNDKHNLELAIFADPARMWDSEGPYVPALYDESRMNRRYQGGYNTVLRWYATWTPKIFMETTLGYNDKSLQVQPWDISDLAYRTVESFDYNTGLYLSRGSQSTFSMNDRTTRQAQIKVTWLVGKHEIKFGGEGEWARSITFQDYSGGQYVQVLYNLGSANPASPNINDYYYQWYVWNQNPRTDERTRYYAGFIQDSWSVSDFFNIKAGVRYEKNEMVPGAGQTLSLDSWSPRIHIAWDWAKNGKSKFYAFFGQYYDRPPGAFTSALDPGHGSYTARYSHYGTKHDYTDLSGNLADLVEPGLAPQYTNEFIVGNSYELKPDLTFDVRYTYRDVGRILEDVGYILPNGGYGYILMNPGTSYWPSLEQTWQAALGSTYAKPPRPIRHYEALTLTLNRRFANRWWMNASYTYSELYGNYDNDVYGYNSPGGNTNVTPLYDVPSSLLWRNQYGPLAGDRPHVIKVQGAYRFDFGLVLGANFNFQSGRPMYKLMGYPQLEQYGYGTLMMQPRTSATRMPSTWTLDVHAEYDFKVWRTDFALFADIFNLTNNQWQTGYYSAAYITPNYVSDVLSGNLTPDPNWGKTTARQAPRYARVGVKVSF